MTNSLIDKLVSDFVMLRQYHKRVFVRLLLLRKSIVLCVGVFEGVLHVGESRILRLNVFSPANEEVDWWFLATSDVEGDVNGHGIFPTVSEVDGELCQHALSSNHLKSEINIVTIFAP